MNCKIALVDSEIDLGLYKNNIIETVDFIEDKTPQNYICRDTNGHGTLCCSAILSVNPSAKILGVKVLNNLNRCSTQSLLSALDYLTETDVNIINLSLATSNIDYMGKYKEIIGKLKKQEKLVIASSANNNEISLPAILPEVIGVKGNMFIKKEDFWYNKYLDIQCIADNKPMLLKSYNGVYELFGGNSKATAIFTGIASKYCNISEIKYPKDLKNIFVQNSKKNEWDKIEDEIPKIADLLCKHDVIHVLEQIVSEVFKISKQDRHLLYEKELFNMGLTRNNAIILIKEIERQFNLKIKYEGIDIYWFYSIKSLYHKIFIEKDISA